MNTSIRALTTAAALAAALGSTVPARAQAEDPSGYGDGYRAGSYGRIRAAEAGATIVRASGETDTGDRSGVNTPIFPGDTIRTDGNQRVEVQLANGTIVRLDRASDVVFQSLPNPSAKFQDNSILTLSAGSLRVTSTLRDKEEFRIDTRDASVYLLGDGEYRIDANPRGGTGVSSLRGVAEVVGNDSSVLVRGGTRTSVLLGQAPENPQAYTAFASDGFDRWCAAREESYRTHDPYAENDGDPGQVPSEVRPYYGELAANGSWINVPQYGSVWAPSGVAAGWQPYSNGYWTYGPGGYFWVSYEPWGWAPYHYGNWQWVGGYGWCWIPGSVFAGAWVSWSWGSIYVGWAPLDYWGRPGWTGGPYYYGYYDPGCWTFVNYGNIGSTNVGRYAVPVGRVGDDLRHATVVARAPRVDPRYVGGGGAGGRQRALRDVANDKAAHLRPIQAQGTPSRTLSDVQTQLRRRPTEAAASPRGWNAAGGDSSRTAKGSARTSAATGSGGSRGAPVVRERRILEDPRQVNRPQSQRSTPGVTRPDSRDGVRDLYQRMSKPRETREQSAAPSVPSRSARAGLPQGSRQPADPRHSRASSGPQSSQSRPDAPRAQAPQRVNPQPAPQRVNPRPAPQRANPQPAPQRVNPQPAPQRANPRAAPQRVSPQTAPRQGGKPAAGQGQSKHTEKKR